MSNITIIGAGLAGVSLAYALRNSKHSITLLDNNPEPEINEHNLNARSIALSYGSYKILSSWQIWENLKPYTTPIKSIHISDRGHFGRTLIQAEDVGVDALGYSVQAQMLYYILYQKLKEYSNIEMIRPIGDLKIESEKNQISFLKKNEIVAETRRCERSEAIQVLQTSDKSGLPRRFAPRNDEGRTSLTADLIILAEGGQSSLLQELGFDREKKDYQQTGIIANVTLSQANQGCAFERFTSEGPIALLPIDDKKMALVWTVATDQSAALLEKNDQDFRAALQIAFGFRAGYFVDISERTSHNFKLEYSENALQNNILLLGNAAHTLHPVAAQGFNLSLADIDVLVTCLMGVSSGSLLIGRERFESLNSPPWRGGSRQADGVVAILKQYISLREQKQQQTIHFTDNLIHLFSNDFFPLTPLRGLGLSVLNNAVFFKKDIARKVMGYY